MRPDIVRCILFDIDGARPMKRREFMTLVAGAGLAWPRSARAQSPKESNRVWKIGILWHASNLPEEQVMFGPLSDGMRELGYADGRNVVYDHTFVDENYDRFGARAQELIDRKVDVILASVPQAAAAAGRLTKTIPIVFAASGDPVKLGLVKSLSQPSGNITGLSLFYPELSVKHLELLREIEGGDPDQSQQPRRGGCTGRSHEGSCSVEYYCGTCWRQESRRVLGCLRLNRKRDR
jgi:putative ABC transport system substrate-binding protein